MPPGPCAVLNREKATGNAAIARANLSAVADFVSRCGGLFSWSPPRAGLVAWLHWNGPGSARDLAVSILAEEKIFVADHTLFGMPDTREQGGVRVGLGPTDMPDRLAKMEAAVARYVRSRNGRL